MSFGRALCLGFAALAIIATLQGIALANPPAAAAPDDSPVFGEWSAKVNGLQARLASLYPDWWETDGIFLEVRNVSQQALTIPSLLVIAPHNTFPWHLQFFDGGAWKDFPWSARPPSTLDARKAGPPVTLQTGETALMRIEGQFDNRIRHRQRFRINLRQSGSGPLAGWLGDLNTPPAWTYPSQNALKHLDGSLSPPTYFPWLSDQPSNFMNDPLETSGLSDLLASNARLFGHLSFYRDAPVARELDRRLAAETNFNMELLLAEQAAARGSVSGKQFVIGALKNVDYSRCRSTLDALQLLAGMDNTPDWALDSMISALNDQRQVTNIPSYFARGTSFTVSWIADEDSLLALRLGDKKCRRAVPTLIQLAKNSDHQRFPIAALGEIGDPAATATLWQIVKTERADFGIQGGSVDPETYGDALESLVELKAGGIEDELLAHAVHADIVKLLEQTGDPRAIPVLRQIVSAGKPKQISGSDAESNRNCVDAARVALATLEPGDPVPRYVALVEDQSLGEFSRREAVWRLGNQQPIDSRAIAVFARAAKEDPSGTVVDNSIIALGKCQDAKAVSALIDLFGANFENKENWKYAYKPDMFRLHIADSLGNITGQSFGLDVEAWKKWWASQHGRLPK